MATTKHYQWFRNLADFHELTLAWIKELQIPRPPYLMTRGLGGDVGENIWMLDSLSPIPGPDDSPDDSTNENEDQENPGARRGLLSLLDDTTPDDVLARLEQTVWAVQAWTLRNVIEKTPQNERPNLLTVLEQVAWKLGRRLAEERWDGLGSESRPQGDLRVLLASMVDTPWGSDRFLVRRAVSTEIQVELLSCPHRSQHSEVRDVADQLCLLHGQWTRGYLYALNNRLTLETEIRELRCVQKWFFAPSANYGRA